MTFRIKTCLLSSANVNLLFQVPAEAACSGGRLARKLSARCTSRRATCCKEVVFQSSGWVE